MLNCFDWTPHPLSKNENTFESISMPQLQLIKQCFAQKTMRKRVHNVNVNRQFEHLYE